MVDTESPACHSTITYDKVTTVAAPSAAPVGEPVVEAKTGKDGSETDQKVGP